MRFYAIIVFVVCLIIGSSSGWADNQVLSQADVKTYRDIFSAQEKGHFKTASSLEKKTEK